MTKKTNNIFEEDTIDIIKILSSLWKNKYFILKFTFIFSFFGFIYSLSLNNIFTASSTFYPHYEANSLSPSQGLKSLAGLAGIDFGNERSDNIPPTLYPNIINSPQFKIDILDTKINYNGTKLSYREYLLNKNNNYDFKDILLYPISLISDLFSKENIDSEIYIDNILKISEEEYKLHEEISDLMLIELNEKERFIKLSVKDNNPMIASQIAKIANEILQKNIIEFKLKIQMTHMNL